MFDFFSQIVGYFQSIFDAIVNVFETLGFLLLAVTEGTTFINAIVLFFPPIIGASVLAVASIAVVKIILGR